MAGSKRALGIVFGLNLVVLAVLAASAWAGALPIDPEIQGLVAAALAAAAVLDALVMLFVLTRYEPR